MFPLRVWYLNQRGWNIFFCFSIIIIFYFYYFYYNYRYNSITIYVIFITYYVICYYYSSVTRLTLWDVRKNWARLPHFTDKGTNLLVAHGHTAGFRQSWDLSAQSWVPFSLLSGPRPSSLYLWAMGSLSVSGCSEGCLKVCPLLKMSGSLAGD